MLFMLLERDTVIRTDVVVLAVAAYVHTMHNVEELWLAFGDGKNFRFIPSCNRDLLYPACYLKSIITIAAA